MVLGFNIIYTVEKRTRNLFELHEDIKFTLFIKLYKIWIFVVRCTMLNNILAKYILS